MRTRNWIWVWILIPIFFLPAFAFSQQDTLILLGRNMETGKYAVSASHDYAFGTDGEPGTMVVDYSDPHTPLSVTRYPGVAFDIEIKDRLAYYVGDSLYIRDISDPLEPQAVGSMSHFPYNWAVRLRLFDTLALVVQSTEPQIIFLDIIDISDPANPQLLSSNHTPGYPWSIYWKMDAWKKDNYVYWADEAWLESGSRAGRIIVLDITDPTTPVPIVVDTCLPSPPTAIWIKGNYAYVALSPGHAGLMVLDISDPYNIDSLGFFETPYGADNVYIKDNLAYVSALGLYVLDITDPSNPSLVTYYDIPGTSMDAFVDEPYVLVAGNSSLLVFRASFLVPGDANWDREVNIIDVVYLINYLFINGPKPPNPSLADANSDCQINADDVVYLMNYLFAEGPPPQAGCIPEI
jgi:hypothetical protein